MKRTKFIVLASICFFALLFFCESLFKPSAENPTSKIDEISDRLTLEFSKEMQNKYGLKMLGMGGGGNKGLNLLSIHFKLDKKIEVSEARAMYISLVQDFIKKINDNEEIRSVLLNYPFEEKNIQIWISCYDLNGHGFEKPYVSFVSQINDAIFFRSGGKGYEPFETLYEEPFEEAVKKVQAIEQSLVEQQPQAPL